MRVLPILPARRVRPGCRRPTAGQAGSGTRHGGKPAAAGRRI